MQLFVLVLTFFRILAAPFILISVIFLENYWFTFWLFNLAALTDYFDGKLARTFKVESRLGAILDPIGDKLLLLFALIAIIDFTQDNYVSIMASFLLAREFWISALREYSSAFNIINSTAVTFIAKTKTAFQFLAISVYFFGAATDLAIINFLANFLLLVSVFLSYKSAIDYTEKTFKIKQ